MMGTLGKLGGSLIFNVQIVDMRSGLVERRYSKRIKGSSEEVFLDAVTAAVEDLFPVQKHKPTVQAPPPPPQPLEKPAPTPTTTPPPEPIQTVAETTATEGPAFAHWSLALRGQGWPLDPARGGAFTLLAGRALTPSIAINIGPMVSGTSGGALLRAGWILLNAGGNLRPIVAIEVPFLVSYRDQLFTPGAGLSLGIEYLPLPWLFVAIDVPVYFLPVIPKDNPNLWIFGSISAGVRI